MPAVKSPARLSPLAPKLLAAAPELAALALLDRALAVAVRALLAEHPTLALLPEPGRVEATTVARARQLLAAIRPLRRAVACYRLAVRKSLLPHPADDDLPF